MVSDKKTIRILVSILFLSLFIIAADYYKKRCVGLIVGSSNEDGGIDRQNLATVMPVYSALPGMRCRWHSFAEAGAFSDDYITQINEGMDYLNDDVDILIIGNTYEVSVGDVERVLANISSTWNRIEDIPYILLIEYPDRDGDPVEAIEKYNQTINEWARDASNVHVVKYPRYIVDEDGMHASEKCLFALGAQIYVTLIENGW